ncbi:methylated-DNA-[protein]-cysteine S-methyltransferase [Paenibacillus algorifonticola]|uniref:Methylated-DNA--protein-cysteine methyltransferase n=1 Tax=Paenibacillus algorifonticola TaxID=684063 RepID=A0A1I2GWQ1_9BACL|nr:methylated-DNA--[protein]-cysteine S-methyltransferase [Paenibacillus algorifonticola]SFF21560.1 methylated-DNA-[protein]-cysteine S-methyltransferase [Paenibacillus algorifonticola]
MRTDMMWMKLELARQRWVLLATERGLCRIVFPHEDLEGWRDWMNKVAPGKEPREDAEAIRRMGIVEWLERYFAGERCSFAEIPLDLIGTTFQQQVWTALGQVPYGETRTYGDIAAAIGRPQAVRAVGAANGANPIPILLPCHRIVGANRKLTGFRGGLEMKRRLLALERIEGIADGGHARFQF